jgi:hypothetical protein
MWRLPEEIRDDLASEDAERIAAGLRDLVEAMEAIDEIELPPLDVSLLAPFSGQVPSQVQHDLARLWARYRSFHPPLEREETLYRVADLAIRYGDDLVALDASLALKKSPDPPALVARILDRVRERGLHSEREVMGVGNYLSYLLDGEPTVRDATIAALKRWHGGHLGQAVDYIRPQLDTDEFQRLAR